MSGRDSRGVPGFSGQLLAIAIASGAKQPMQVVDTVEALADFGLVGDRYSEGRGASQRGPARAEQQLTLIAEEALSAASDRLLLPFEHMDSRRNLLTRGVPLNDLVRRSFWIGEVLARGMQLCEPCGYLERMTQAGIKEILKGNGGLRAQILQGGTLRTGATIRPATTAEVHAVLQRNRA
jgi:MOSC domain-containing protein YiiM